MAIDDGNPESEQTRIATIADYIFTAIFTVEAFIRIIASGFYSTGEHAYIRDPFNRLDFLVVLLSFVQLLAGGANLSFFRALRILKPLRAIKAIDGLRVLTSALFEALPGLSNVLVFFSFCLFVFGIVGMQAFGGRLTDRCFSGSGVNATATGRLCTQQSILDPHFCKAAEECVNTGQNPDYGITSFDNILVSWLTILIVTSLEGWVDIMYYCQDSVSAVIASLYFVFVVVWLALFVMNLILAVIFIKFDAEKNKRTLIIEEENYDAGADDYSFFPIKSKEEKSEQKGAELDKLDGSGDDSLADVKTSALEGKLRKPRPRLADSPKKIRPPGERQEDSKREGDSKRGRVESSTGRPDGTVPRSVIMAQNGGVEMVPINPSTLGKHQSLEDKSCRFTDNGVNAAALSELEEEHANLKKCCPNLACWDYDWFCFDCPVGWNVRVKAQLEKFVNTPAFQGWIYIAIFINMLLLCMEHYGMSSELATFLETSNVILTAIFALEMALKLMGLGWKVYADDGMNQFDAVIVIVSVFELSFESSSGLSALRCFRLLRILKLFRNWKDLRNYVTALFNSIEEIAYFLLLMFLFMFIYAILGTQLFRDKYVVDGENQRPNFDGFLWSMLTVFQIITGENWNEVLRVGVKVAGWGSALYFVTLYIFGGILLDLFLAILLANLGSASKSNSGAEGEEDDEPTLMDLVKAALWCDYSTYKRKETSPEENKKESPGDAKNGTPTRKAFFSITPAEKRGDAKAVDDGTTSIETDNDAGSTSQKVQQRRELKELLVKQLSGRSLTGNGNGSLDAPARQGSVRSLSVVASESTDRKEFNRAPSGRSLLVDTTSRGGTPTPVDALKRPSTSDGAGRRVSTRKWRRARRSAMGSDSGSADSRGGGRNSMQTPPLPLTRGRSAFSISTRRADPFERKFTNLHRSRRSTLQNPTLPARAYAKADEGTDILLVGDSFGFFAPDSPFRVQMAKIVVNDWFDYFIYFLIGVSCVLLTLDTPQVEEGSQTAQTLFVFDLILTVLFSIELVMKCIAFTCYGDALCTAKVGAEDNSDTDSNSDANAVDNAQQSSISGALGRDGIPPHVEADTKYPPYFLDAWNRLDAFVVLISILNLFAGTLKFFKAFRALRSFRAIRTVTRSESTRAVINTIYKTGGPIANILLIALMIFLIFAVIGVQFFQGRLQMCIEDDGTQQPTYTKAECLSLNHRWTNPYDRHFDNVPCSMLLLFEVASLEMWPDIMYSVIDATPPDEPPKENYNPAASLYFVFFLVFGSFLIISMFVGAVVGVYNRESESFSQDASGGKVTEEVEQLMKFKKLWLEAYKLMVETELPVVMIPPVKEWRKKIFDIVQSSWFDVTIMSVISCNILFMAMVYEGASDEYIYALEILNDICTYVFIIEMALKWIGLGVGQYFKSSWNQFDFVLVFISIVVLSIRSSVTFAFDPTLLRVFRILRIFRLLQHGEGIKRILRTLGFSMPALSNVSALLGLVMFVWAVMGMSLFGNVKSGDFINEHANFRTFLRSFLTLIRVTTGESWNGLMHDCMVRPPECTEGEDCGDPIVAPIFFLSYVVLSTFLMLNLFVAVVLKNFEEEEERGGANEMSLWAMSPITQNDIKRYSLLWSKRFPNQRFIPVSDLMLWNVQLQFADSETVEVKRNGVMVKELRHFPFKMSRGDLKALDIPVWENQVHYLSILQRIALRRFWMAYKHTHATLVRNAKAKGRVPPEPLQGNGVEQLYRGIAPDNQLLKCIRASVQSLYPELSKLKTFLFLSNQYFAQRMLKTWWVKKQRTRGKEVKFIDKEKAAEEKKACWKVFLSQLRVCLCEDRYVVL